VVDKVDPRTGELVTTNYGWTKPTVGASVDAWGGYINADLDGIDSTVHSIQTSVPAASSTTPAMDGTAAVGTGTTWARADHVHPVDASRAPLASPALSGVPTAPTAAVGTNTTQVATTAFVAAATVAVMGDNRIINGDMRIDQRNNGASGTANQVYTIDRWKYVGSQTAKGTWGQNLGAVTRPSAFPYYLGFQSSSTYSLATADFFILDQIIEADYVSDFAWSTASAQPVTLSFWAYSSLTGAFGGAIANFAQTRSYPFTYSIPTANVWTKIAVTVPGDTGGTWVMSGNAGALFVAFDLGSGATYRGPAGAWVSAAYFGATGSVSVVTTNGATFYVTGVKLEIGSIATPFNRQSTAKSMADCQRYYQTIAVSGRWYAAAVSTNALNLYWAPMRSSPTATLITAGTRGNVSSVTFGQYQVNSGNLSWAAVAAGDMYILGDIWSLSAEF
jgi:hypothetical protein